MSGGTFEYKQYQIEEIADQIERELARQGREKSPEELWCNDEYYKQYPQERFHQTYPERVQLEFRSAIETLRKAAVYVQRVDWYLAGDDGEETFLKRLEDDLGKIKQFNPGGL